jgi:hypothetical protein
MNEIAADDGMPDMKISVRQVFGIDSDMEAPAYSYSDPHVPDVDPISTATSRASTSSARMQSSSRTVSR